MLPVRKLKDVEGKMLTFIEAILSPGQQCESAKSMVRQIIGELYSYVDYEEKVVTGSTTDQKFNTIVGV